MRSSPITPLVASEERNSNLSSAAFWRAYSNDSVRTPQFTVGSPPPWYATSKYGDRRPAAWAAAKSIPRLAVSMVMNFGAPLPAEA